MEEKKCIGEHVTSYEVAHWPEFIAFAERLGIPMNLRWMGLTIALGPDPGDVVKVTHVYQATDVDRENAKALLSTDRRSSVTQDGYVVHRDGDLMSDPSSLKLTMVERTLKVERMVIDGIEVEETHLRWHDGVTKLVWARGSMDRAMLDDSPLFHCNYSDGEHLARTAVRRAFLQYWKGALPRDTTTMHNEKYRTSNPPSHDAAGYSKMLSEASERLDEYLRSAGVPARVLSDAVIDMDMDVAETLPGEHPVCQYCGLKLVERVVEEESTKPIILVCPKGHSQRAMLEHEQMSDPGEVMITGEFLTRH